MITDRRELIRHDLHVFTARPHFLKTYRERAPRELYLSGDFCRWCKTVLPKLQSTQYAVHETPAEEVFIILNRFAAGARLVVEPDEDTPGDIKRLEPPENSIWELKTGDIRIFGWFLDHDCFVVHSGDDATSTKVSRGYCRHIAAVLKFLSQSGLKACVGDHRHVLTL